MQWYVIHAYSGFEIRVKKLLEERISRSDALRDQFGKILVPTEEVVEMRSGQKRRSERKFFPGYVLVHMDLNERVTWHLGERDGQRVMGFIGGKADASGEPLSPSPPVKRTQILDSRTGRQREGYGPRSVFEPGELVRVVDGPFNDFNGVVEEVNYEKSRLRVAVLIFGRSTPVELDFAQVEKD